MAAVWQTMAQSSSKNERVTLRLTPEQHRLIDQRAKRCGVRMTVWMRSILLQVASRQEASDGYLRVREPKGATT
jgi:uncharacterized protein (DUF1778 family)